MGSPFRFLDMFTQDSLCSKASAPAGTHCFSGRVSFLGLPSFCFSPRLLLKAPTPPDNYSASYTVLMSTEAHYDRRGGHFRGKVFKGTFILPRSSKDLFEASAQYVSLRFIASHADRFDANSCPTIRHSSPTATTNEYILASLQTSPLNDVLPIINSHQNFWYALGEVTVAKSTKGRQGS